MLPNILIVCVILYSKAVMAVYNSQVLLWGANSTAKPALGTLQAGDFAELMMPLMQTHMVLVFLEKNLTSKDFLCQKPHSTDSCYLYLNKVYPKTYYTSVQAPFEIIYSMATDLLRHTVQSRPQINVPILQECKAGQVHVIDFNDTGLINRTEALIFHDSVISIVRRGMRCLIIGLYISDPQTVASIVKFKHIRRRRQTEEEDNGEIDTEAVITGKDESYGTLISEGNSIIYFSKAIVTEGGKSESRKYTRGGTIPGSDNNFYITLREDDGNGFAMELNLWDQGYKISSIRKDEYIYNITNFPMVPFGKSFACNPFSIKTKTRSLLLKNFQFQAFRDESTGKFGAPFYCDNNGFMTCGIIMGLFVSAILLSITFCGISWIMDINATDRFEDPNGKQMFITILE